MRYPVIYSNNIAEWQAGFAWGPLIFIRPAYREDEGLYQHELTHVKQWFLTLTLHWFLYRIRRYRLWAEARAYHKQMQYPDRNGKNLSLDDAAERLAANYDLGITVEQAKKYI